MRKPTLVLALLVAMALVPATGSGSPIGFTPGSCEYPAGKPLPGAEGVQFVGPDGHATIQEAVTAASEGDTILIASGVYRESVTVRTPGLRIRGLDRNAVVVDGEFKDERTVGILVKADRVVVENLTVTGFARDAVRWDGVTGYWGRYLTAYNNGRYGPYAFDARCGQIDHSYASGHPDSGFYIGQCFPCDAVIHDIVAEENALGYSGTNAGGNLLLKDSIWRNNALGIVPNTLDGEERPPQRGTTIANNLVLNNSNRTAPGTGLAGCCYGAGIVIAGGTGNVVTGNTLVGHEFFGIVLAPLPDQKLWIPTGNTIWANHVSGSGVADLAQGAISGANNCWADNQHATSTPPMIQDIWSCALATTPPGGSPIVEAELGRAVAGLGGRDPGDHTTWPAPEPQPNQPDDDGDGSYANDGAVDGWLPALL